MKTSLLLVGSSVVDLTYCFVGTDYEGFGGTESPASGQGISRGGCNDDDDEIILRGSLIKHYHPFT